MFTADQIKGKNVLIRADFDVPVRHGRIENDFRLEAMMPTISLCLEHASHTLLIGHMGRPGGQDDTLSLSPIKEWLITRLNRDISFISSGLSPGEWWTGDNSLSIMDNLRFNPNEEKEDRGFASLVASGADIYIYEAFATYRPCASMRIIPEIIPTLTGFQFDKEVSSLSKVLQSPAHPTLLIASGAKTDKLETVHKISHLFDTVLLGGKLANSQHLTSDTLDLNEAAIDLFLSTIAQAKTIVFNGPVGMYEDGTHARGTKLVLQALKDSSAFTIIGGGDTLAAMSFLGFENESFGFVSTGGGAMLEFLASGTHPLLEVLKSGKNSKINH